MKMSRVSASTAHQPELPLERQVEYVAALGAIAWALGWAAWAFWDFLLPPDLTRPSRAKWANTASGLTLIAGASWILSEQLF